MPISTELFNIANNLTPYTEFHSEGIEKLINTSSEIAKSWSGSWLGYHSRIYYENFETPPPGAAFSQEWGLIDLHTMGSRGNWTEYNFDDVVNLIKESAGNPNLQKIIDKGTKAITAFETAKSSTLSIIHSSFGGEKDNFLQKILDKIEAAKIHKQADFIKHFRPSGKMMSRDIIAAEKGIITPPHIMVLSEALAAKSPFQDCLELQKQIKLLASHIQNLEKRNIREERIGTNIFIGHGRSPFWRELKDFINDRLGLPWDEFNRIPVAGVTNITRLSQMLDQASFAFLIMTAEDEQLDGNVHARMNVIHEVGLFQGRLGFERAIVLLEEGCQEFSNIQGLGQIRFPKGNIPAIFEEIRSVLERESII